MHSFALRTLLSHFVDAILAVFVTNSTLASDQMNAVSKILDTTQFLWDRCSQTKLLEVPSVFRFVLDTGGEGLISLVELPWHDTSPVCGSFFTVKLVQA